MDISTADRAILAILESLPTHPTSGQILGALVRAERAGYERAVTEIREGISSMAYPVTQNGERWDEGFRRGFQRGVADGLQVCRFLGGAEIPRGYPEEFARRIPALLRRQAG